MQEYINMLGTKAKDMVTGFNGTITSVCFDLYGCIQFALTPELSKEGRLDDGRWFDTNRLEYDTTQDRIMSVPNFPTRLVKNDKGPAEKPTSSKP